MKYVILYGNIVDGMWFEGPYDSLEDANRMGDETNNFIVEFLYQPGKATGESFPGLPLKYFRPMAAEILLGVTDVFPGLVNGEDEVNGGDLVDYLSSAFAHRHQRAKEMGD